MVVQIIDVRGVTVLEAEDHTPVCPHGHRPVTGIVAFERMQTEAGQVHVVRRRGRIQTRDYIAHDIPMFGIDLPVLSALIEAFERLLLKRRITLLL